MTATVHSTNPFSSKGPKPEWELVYDYIRQLKVGEVAKYSEITLSLGRDFLDQRSPFYKALRVLEENDNRSMKNVPGVGYEVVPAAENEKLARSHSKRAHRQLVSARRKITTADRSQLDKPTAARFDRIEMNLSRQVQMTRRLEDRVAVLERAVVETKTSGTDTVARLERLEAALRRQNLLEVDA